MLKVLSYEIYMPMQVDRAITMFANQLGARPSFD